MCNEEMSGYYTRAKSMATEDRALKSTLIAARRDIGFTQADIAVMMGVDVEEIYEFERYDSDPTMSFVRRYANMVEVTVAHSIHR